MKLPPRYLLDANVVLRFGGDDHPAHHRRAIKLFARAAMGDCELVLQKYVLAEVVFTLESYYELPRAEIAGFLRGLLKASGVVVEGEAQCRDAVDRYQRTKADFVDCLLAAEAADESWAVASFDNDFDAFSDVERHEP